MRTPVISRIVRTSATAVAALTIGVGLPLTVGANAAYACGDEPADAASATAPQSPGPVSGETVSGFIAPTPTAITAGGPKVEIGVEEANFSGAAIDRAAPSFALYDEQAGGHGIGTMLTIDELSVEVMAKGRWTPLKLHTGCDPVIWSDTTALAEPLADGHAHRFLFRVGLSAGAPLDQTGIQIYSGRTAEGKLNRLDLDVKHPTPPAPKPTATPTTAAPTTPAQSPTAAPTKAAPIALTSGPSTPAGTPSAATSATELAATGPSAPTGFLFASAAGCLAVGLGVLYLARRQAKR
ncbi:hypothetical protein AB0K43_07170 [Kitasatospora sp. NPDC049258]|uniref:hypothetical protein n=1 Tax=Kitasatospora sp. NPDC049258 TaxID=3155394 RepID=UPI003419708C